MFWFRKIRVKFFIDRKLGDLAQSQVPRVIYFGSTSYKYNCDSFTLCFIFQTFL